MEPGKTSFFQALGVPTKIARGTIEITSDLKLVEAGSKVGASEATLLNMLNISPFTYGMSIAQIYDQGQTFAPSVLDIEESQLLKAFSSAINTIATVSLAVNYPTLPSVMHSVVNSYKNALAIAVETEYEWDGIEELKDRIKNPDNYAAAAPTAAASAADAGGAAEETKEEKKEEEEEEEVSHRSFATNAHTNKSRRTRTWVSVCLTKWVFINYMSHNGDLHYILQESHEEISKNSMTDAPDECVNEMTSPLARGICSSSRYVFAILCDTSDTT